MGTTDPIDFTEQDLIEAILAEQTAKQDAPGAITVQELMAQTVQSASRITKRLRELDREGRLQSVRVRRRNIAGIPATVPAYRLKPKEEASI